MSQPHPSSLHAPGSFLLEAKCTTKSARYSVILPPFAESRRGRGIIARLLLCLWALRMRGPLPPRVDWQIRDRGFVIEGKAQGTSVPSVMLPTLRKGDLEAQNENP